MPYGYRLSRNFVAAYRNMGVSVMWRTYFNTPHRDPDHFYTLAMAFLGHYHKLYEAELAPGKKVQPVKEKPLYVGDDLEHVYYPVDSPKAKNILPQDRVLLPTLELARAWGKEG